MPAVPGGAAGFREGATVTEGPQLNVGSHLAALKAVKPRRALSHTVRTRDRGFRTFQKLLPRLAIKLCCMECLGWEADPKTDCTSPLCPLWLYRGRTLASQTGDKQ